MSVEAPFPIDFINNFFYEFQQYWYNVCYYITNSLINAQQVQNFSV